MCEFLIGSSEFSGAVLPCTICGCCHVGVFNACVVFEPCLLSRHLYGAKGGHSGLAVSALYSLSCLG